VGRRLALVLWSGAQRRARRERQEEGPEAESPPRETREGPPRATRRRRAQASFHNLPVGSLGMIGSGLCYVRCCCFALGFVCLIPWCPLVFGLVPFIFLSMHCPLHFHLFAGIIFMYFCMIFGRYVWTKHLKPHLCCKGCLPTVVLFCWLATRFLYIVSSCVGCFLLFWLGQGNLSRHLC